MFLSTHRHPHFSERLVSSLILGLLLVGRAAHVQAQTVPPELYFVAIGDVASDLVDHLVAHFTTRYRIPIKTLPPLASDRLAFNDQRSQMVADTLIQTVRARHATLARDPRTRVIAVTPHDMYMRAMQTQWSFTFSLRSSDQRFAVVSYARMDPANLGQPPDAALLRSRLRKMIAKNIGIIYYALSTNQNRRSALFGNVLGVDDLDEMTEEFDPR